MNIQISDRTADIPAFMAELTSPKPVKRRYGKIKKIDVYSWPLWAKIVIPAVLVASLVTVTLLVTGVIDFPSLFSDTVEVPEGMTTVPNVEGMTTDTAMQTLQDAGLTPVPKGNVESSYVAPGLILLQTPTGGSFVTLGGEIQLTVSSGGEVKSPVNGIATVPYVVWNTQADAETKLQKAGLKYKITTAHDDDVAAGMVISQSLEANTQVAVDTEITLVISLGQEVLLSVPNVVGKSQGQAKSELGTTGFAVAVTVEYSDTVSAGTVIRQTPDPATSHPKGTTVSIVVSAGVNNATPANHFTYTVSNGQATITDFPENYQGDVIIPISLGGYPVTRIASNAFRYCKLINSVTIPNSVTSIGGYVFYFCESLTSVTIPDSVTTIEGGLFYFCESLTSVTIPSSVTSIGEACFDGCSSLTSITVNSGNPKYRSAGNCIIDATTRTLVAGCKTSVIPSDGSVKIIGPNAFAHCEGLTSVTIPSSVTTIEHWGFYNCGLTSITIPSSVTSIEKEAFASCDSITSITIPSSVTSIANSSFSDCSSLNSITVNSGNPKYRSVGNCLIEAATKTLVAGCKTSVIPSDGSVKIIGEYAFYYCVGLTSITIPSSVTSIERSAFSSCRNLTSVTIPNSVTSIGEQAFGFCDSLTSVTIPNSVTSIGDYAFGYCDSLTSVTIGSGVTSIGQVAFSYCDSLTTVYFKSEAQKNKFASFFDSNVTLIVQ